MVYHERHGGTPRGAQGKGFQGVSRSGSFRLGGLKVGTAFAHSPAPPSRSERGLVMEEPMKKRRQLMIFALVMSAGLPMVLASVPRSDLTNDTAIYQDLHEIKLTKTHSLSFDS